MMFEFLGIISQNMKACFVHLLIISRVLALESVCKKEWHF